jgi:hypothetical protein
MFSFLLVEGKEEEGFYVERALSPSLQIGSIFLPKIISPEKLGKEDLSIYHAIGLINVKRLSSPDLARLIEYVEGGGGLFISLGKGIDIPFYAVPLQRFFSSSISPPERTPVDKSQFLTLTDLDMSHPLLSVFRDPKSGNLTVVKFFRRHPIKVRKESNVLARFSDGAPALLEGSKPSNSTQDLSSGKEKVLLLAAPPTLAWSDFPLKALFVPFIHRIFLYLSMGEEIDLDLLTGEDLFSPLDSLSGTIELTSPSGQIR